MNLKEIQDLIKFISKSKVDEVSIERKDFKINIKRNMVQEVVASNPIAAPIVQKQVVIETPASVSTPQVETVAAQDAVAAPANDGTPLKSPMIGTFYRRPSPDKPNFVEVGDMVEQGQVICIIEAMKLFNEIEADMSGKILKVLVDDSEPVEYDQPLFIIDPS